MIDEQDNNFTEETSAAHIRMSIIVPVFNGADSLNQCIASLAVQSAPWDCFEAIFVDDGSTDNSLEICNAAKRLFPFIRIIEQDNQGVSNARNSGIAHARGDYIMFLDADDCITYNTVESLITKFDSFGKKTDVVGYRLRYHYAATGKESYHAREKWLKRNGVYKLDRVPFIAHSTMNICVRNRFKNNIFFNEDLKVGEDQLYITQNLKRKASYGYCMDAEYIYVRDSTTASSRFSNPLYSFDDMIKLFEELLRIGEDNPSMLRYAHNLILYNVAWRMKSNVLFPQHLKGIEKVLAEESLARVLCAIPYKTYQENPYLDSYHKAYLFDKYIHHNQIVKTLHTVKRSVVAFECGAIWTTDAPVAVIERCQYYDNLLKIKGRVICPTFLFEGKPELYFMEEPYEQQLDLSVSSYCYVFTHYPVARNWSFSFELDLSDATEMMLVPFRLVIDGKNIPFVRTAFKPRMHNARIIDKDYFYPYLTIKMVEGTMALCPNESYLLSERYIKHDMKYKNAMLDRFRLESLIIKSNDKRYWMYVDQPTLAADDNALAMILHDLPLQDGVERYYVSNFADNIVERHPELDGHVIEARSDMHKLLYLRSEIILHSYIEQSTFDPFSATEFRTVADLVVNQSRVYLQHGVLHAFMPWQLSYDRTLVDKVVISTTIEKEAMTSVYGFPEDALIESGAPRLDLINPMSATESRKIIYIPSWRSYLVTGNPSDKKTDDGIFLASSFYKGLTGFVNLLCDSGFLEERNLTLDIKLHPAFKSFEHFLDFKSERINVVDEQINVNEYAIAVTDFSSYIYDFMYAGAKTFCFIPDRIEFDAELNQYNKLLVPLESFFDAYCETPEEALEGFKKLLDNRRDSSNYTCRDRLFLHTDGKNRDRLYDEIFTEADDARLAISSYSSNDEVQSNNETTEQADDAQPSLVTE